MSASATQGGRNQYDLNSNAVTHHTSWQTIEHMQCCCDSFMLAFQVECQHKYIRIQNHKMKYW